MQTSKAQRSTASTSGYIRTPSKVHSLRKLKRHPRRDAYYLLLDILAGQALRAMEASKHLVALPDNEIPAEVLSRIVSDRCYKDWSRIAAAYALGFLSDSVPFQQTLRKVLSDGTDKVRVRCHVAESLGNLRDAKAVGELRSRLFDDAESTVFRKWCIYALGEIHTRSSRTALAEFSATKPAGVLAKELELVNEGQLVGANQV